MPRLGCGGPGSGVPGPCPQGKEDDKKARDRIAKIKENGGKCSKEEAKALLRDLSKMTVKQLHSLKKDHGVKASGKKSELVKKLADRLKEKYAKEKQETPKKETPVEKPEKDYSKGPKAYALETKGDPPKEVTNQVHKALSTIPDQVHDAVVGADSPGKVVVVNKVTDELPGYESLNESGFGGWGAGTLPDGVHTSSGNRAIVASHYLVGGKEYQSNRVVGTARHEYGHSVDQALNWASTHADFIEAYNIDNSSIPVKEKEGLAYFTHVGDGIPYARARSEAFAELFAQIHKGKDEHGTGGCSYNELAKHFPRTVSVIKSKIDGLIKGKKK
jgi:hypothetical protein